MGGRRLESAGHASSLGTQCAAGRAARDINESVWINMAEDFKAG
jgi:hypothetical protein